jgi:hypothetical protein
MFADEKNTRWKTNGARLLPIARGYRPASNEHEREHVEHMTSNESMASMRFVGICHHQSVSSLEHRRHVMMFIMNNVDVRHNSDRIDQQRPLLFFVDDR